MKLESTLNQQIEELKQQLETAQEDLEFANYWRREAEEAIIDMVCDLDLGEEPFESKNTYTWLCKRMREEYNKLLEDNSKV